MNAPEHYYSREPGSPEHRRELTITVGGRELRVVTANGVFSAHRLDPGTRVLLRHAEAPTAGDLLDLGCGWGPMTLAMASASPRATVWAVDVNERALRLTQENARRAGLERVRAHTPAQVPDDVTFATIWSNPPIRIGKAAVHELLQRWLPRLSDAGTAWLVVQRNLGADPLQAWLTELLAGRRPVRRVGSAKGYRVLAVGPSGAAGPGHRDRYRRRPADDVDIPS
jgi:16S rRNA (guanine1207-N2)-methyltransferase